MEQTEIQARLDWAKSKNLAKFEMQKEWLDKSFVQTMNDVPRTVTIVGLVPKSKYAILGKLEDGTLIQFYFREIGGYMRNQTK